MSKKVLNTQSIINELRGQSAFFKQDAPMQSKTDDPKPPTVRTAPKKPKKRPESNIEKETPKAIPNPEHFPIPLPVEKKNDTVSNKDSNHASMQASMLANIQDDTIETIRK